MNSKDFIDKTPERPSETYTLDPDGSIVRSRGLRDFDGRCWSNTMSKSSSLTSISTLSSPFEPSASSFKSSSSDDIKAANNLLHYIDEIEDSIVKPRVPRRFKLSSLTEISQTKPGPSTGDIETIAASTPTKQIADASSIGLENQDVRAYVPPEIKFYQDEGEALQPTTLASQDGMMAVRLPPLRQYEDHRDIFRRKLNDKIKLEILDILPQSQVAIDRKAQKTKLQQMVDCPSGVRLQSTSTKEITVKQSSPEDELNDLIIEIQSKIATIDADELYNESTHKKKGWRKYLCGVCGGMDESEYSGEAVEETDKKISGNVLQSVWRRLRKLF
ncbi:hypothetical protein ACF0H5_009245 [Mactra antiquata]